MPYGCLMRNASPPPASSWKRFLPCRTTRGLMFPGGINSVWRDGSASAARQRIARNISLYVQRYFGGGVCHLSP